jgi:hypothetical protein
MLAYPKDKEKRQYRRLPALSLTAEIKSKKGLFSTWETVRGVDFNLFGVALILTEEPELSTKTQLKLTLSMDMAEIKLNPIDAKIVNKIMIDSSKGEWRVGFLFTNQSKHSAETKKQLTRINEYLERNNALKERLQD